MQLLHPPQPLAVPAAADLAVWRRRLPKVAVLEEGSVAWKEVEMVATKAAAMEVEATEVVQGAEKVVADTDRGAGGGFGGGGDGGGAGGGGDAVGGDGGTEREALH